MFKRTFGCGSLLMVFVITVAALGGLAFWGYNQYVSPYLNDAEIQELITIYSGLSEEVNEEELVTNPVEVADYDNARTKMQAQGIEVFNEHGDIDPNLIEESNFFASGNVTLTDTELAGMINEFISNPLNLQKVGIDTTDIGGLNTEILEVNIDTVDGTNVDLSFIVKLDLTQIKQELDAILGFFLPNAIYITNTNSLTLVDGSYQLVSGNIRVNNLSEELNNRMFEIMVDALEVNQPELTVTELNEGMGNLILDGITELANVFGTTVTFSDGSVTFIPTPQV